MKRLLQAPNLALATLWADQLSAAGFAARVLRAHACGIAGEIPPDQALPEVWLDDDSLHAEAKALFDRWMHAPERRWACPGCGEVIEGPFDLCWNCGAACPAP
ncbi:MAG: DUF2007 domain-containing protein [Rubrivivax sp.]|nr:DUF2007 domain-containing protein [Rubrivivax sp.]MCL4697552.1 DUF2007 domain-containing protein [Burkholderiaceae bacterium]